LSKKNSSTHYYGRMSEQWDFGPIPSEQAYISLLLNCLSANSLRPNHAVASSQSQIH
jgi:hypothetical protein